MLGRIVAAALIGIAATPADAQILPPPSLPGQDRIAEQLVQSIETKNVAAYAALLSDSLTVTDGGEVIAQNKDEWLDSFGKKLSAEGVSFTVSPGFSSTGRLLFIEYFNSAGSWGGDVPALCCWSYDAVAYDLSGGKIVTIQRLRGGDKKLDERGRPMN